MVESAAPPHDRDWLASYSRELRKVDDYETLVELMQRKLHEHFSLTNAWLYVFEWEDDDHAVLVAAAGSKARAIEKELPVAPLAGDWLTAALRRGEGPIIIPDALGSQGNPDVAARLGNRTVVNVPIGVVDHALGVLGGGTFGDEGPVALDAQAVAEIALLANVTSVAVARLVLRSRDAARAQLQARLAQRQRLESLGLLAGGVAHDFNNLLTVIRASIEFIGEGPLTEAQRNDLSVAIDAERAASTLTKRLLTLGRQEPPRFASADINQVVHDFLRLIERVVPASIQIDFVAGAALPQLRIDSHQIEQVLMNLALNARDAMPEGGRLAVETQQVVVNGEYRRAHPWAKSGRYVLLTVTDTGVGMPPEVVERVFEPFYTTKEKSKGTGLGLAVAWGIIQEHGGMVHCYSEPNLGTSFKIYLPAGEVAATEVGNKLAGAVPRGSERILVADDQPQLLAILCRILTRAGYTVTAASNGVEAVEAAKRESFDLYLLDAIMPQLSGVEAIERISDLRPNARFLLVSGYGEDTLPRGVQQGHSVELISKPFEPDAVLRAVRAKLDS